MKTILLTGATGFLGSHLLEALLAEGYLIVLLKRSTSDTWRIENLLPRTAVYDIDKVSLEQVFEIHKVDAILHLATLYRKYDSGKEIAEMLASNVTFPCELIEVGLRHGVKAFVNTGTFFEVDCSSLPVTENAASQPFNFYAKTKLAFESILRGYTPALSSVTLRLFSPYGPRDNEKLIPILLRKSLADEKIELSQGLQKLDFIYVSDIVRAYLAALKYCQREENVHQVFNIGTGRPTSIREVVSILEQALQKPIVKQWGAVAVNEIPIVFADTSKARELLGWESNVSIEEGLNETLSYYRGRA